MGSCVVGWLWLVVCPRETNPPAGGPSFFESSSTSPANQILFLSNLAERSPTGSLICEVASAPGVRSALFFSKNHPPVAILLVNQSRSAHALGSSLHARVGVHQMPSPYLY